MHSVTTLQPQSYTAWQPSKSTPTSYTVRGESLHMHACTQQHSFDQAQTLTASILPASRYLKTCEISQRSQSVEQQVMPGSSSGMVIDEGIGHC